ncbi:MAG: bifunctional serine/threonine-protein kinase/formylglycine-generating enzyme family protein [Planctomycetota bacterium]
MPNQEQQLRELFSDAILLAPSEWAGFLDQRCPDPVLRARVQLLLDHHVASADFLSRPAIETYPSVAGSIGSQVAEFHLIREIGRGGMGVVYLAKDTVLNRKVALKVLSPQLDAANIAAGRFRKEAQAVARLSHPGIVQVYRFGEERGFSYIAMEYVEGGTLRARLLPDAPSAPATSRIHRRRWSPFRTQAQSAHLAQPDGRAIAAAARVVSEVADALDHAHRQGVIHRDIKPSNILIDRDDHARLTDFGVARITSEETLSRENEISGSYPYMSPEQARVEAVEIDHRSDIFSLGVVLYELLTGKRPFDGATTQAILRALSDGRPQPIGRLAPSVPSDLAVICHKAIEKHPVDRYQTAAHLAADLRCFLSGRPILARAPSVGRRSRLWLSDHRRGLTVTAFLLLAILAGSLAWGWQQQRLARQGAVSLHAVDASLPISAVASRFDPVSRSFGEDIQLGSVPVRKRYLAPGIYRFVMTDSAGRFADFHDVVVPGSELDRTAQLLPSGPQLTAMVRFEGGRMPAVFNDPGDGEREQTTPVLAPFLIDEAEVTNREYLAFTKASQRSAPDYWSRAKWNEIAELPVVALSRDEMQAYALWAGKRLPTIYEWLAAAQAPDGRQTPWIGAVPASALPPVDGVRAKSPLDPAALETDYRQFAHPVRSMPELRTAAGLYHMFGNVREMTGTVIVQGQQALAVCGGGDWSVSPPSFTLASIAQYPLSARSPQIGFRCARSVSSPAGTK